MGLVPLTPLVPSVAEVNVLRELLRAYTEGFLGSSLMSNLTWSPPPPPAFPSLLVVHLSSFLPPSFLLPLPPSLFLSPSPSPLAWLLY